MASTRRFPGGVLNWPTAAGLASRDRILISSCVVLITAMAWFYLIHLDRQMSASMEYEQKMAAMGMTMHQPWSAADALFTFAMWVVMMVGMMAASVMPMLLLFAGSNASRGEDLAWLNVPISGLGRPAGALPRPDRPGLLRGEAEDRRNPRPWCGGTTRARFPPEVRRRALPGRGR